MKKWRAKKVNIPVGLSGRLGITFRRFKTSKSSRSKKYKQLVVPVGLFTVRETAIRFYKTSGQGRAKPNGKALKRLSQAVPLTLMVIGVFGVGYFGKQILLPHQITPQKTFTTVASHDAKQASTLSLPASVPTKINIPSVEINVGIVTVGKDSNGAIAMPPLNEWLAGWYKYSPTPGQIGPSVIVGHLDTYTSTSVFWNLKDIRPGALIYISRADGWTAVFKATSLEEVSQTDFPTAEVYGNINYAGLRLITCGGNYNPAVGHYDKNTVVYATMVSVKP